MTVGCRQPPTVCRARTPTELFSRPFELDKAVCVGFSQRGQGSYAGQTTYDVARQTAEEVKVTGGFALRRHSDWPLGLRRWPSLRDRGVSGYLAICGKKCVDSFSGRAHTSGAPQTWRAFGRRSGRLDRLGESRLRIQSVVPLFLFWYGSQGARALELGAFDSTRSLGWPATSRGNFPVR